MLAAAVVIALGVADTVPSWSNARLVGLAAAAVVATDLLSRHDDRP